PTGVWCVRQEKGGEPQRQGLLALVVQQHAGEDVLVPARDEREDRRCDEPGCCERKQDLEKRSEPSAAIDHCRLLELPRDVDDEASERPDAEREGKRHV